MLDETAAHARRLADREADQRAREAAADEAWTALRVRADLLGHDLTGSLTALRRRALDARSEALADRAAALDAFVETLDRCRARLAETRPTDAEPARLTMLRRRLTHALAAEVSELSPGELEHLVTRALGERETGPLRTLAAPAVLSDTPRSDVEQEALLLAYWAEESDEPSTPPDGEPTPAPAAASPLEPAPRGRLSTGNLEAARIESYDDSSALPAASAAEIAAEVDAWRADAVTDDELDIDALLDTDMTDDAPDGLAAWLGTSSGPPAAAPPADDAAPEREAEPVEATVQPLAEDSLLGWEAEGLGAEITRLVDARTHRGAATAAIEIVDDPFAAFDAAPLGDGLDGSVDDSAGGSANESAGDTAERPAGQSALLEPFGAPRPSDWGAVDTYDDPFDESSLEDLSDDPIARAAYARHNPFEGGFGTASGPDGELIDFDAAFREAFATGADALDSVDVFVGDRSLDDLAFDPVGPFPSDGGSRPRDPRLAAAYGAEEPSLGSLEDDIEALRKASSPAIPPPLGLTGELDAVGFDLGAAIAAAEDDGAPRDAAADFGDALSPLDETPLSAVVPRAFDSLEDADTSWAGWPTPLRGGALDTRRATPEADMPLAEMPIDELIEPLAALDALGGLDALAPVDGLDGGALDSAELNGAVELSAARDGTADRAGHDAIDVMDDAVDGIDPFPAVGTDATHAIDSMGGIPVGHPIAVTHAFDRAPARPRPPTPPPPDHAPASARRATLTPAPPERPSSTLAEALDAARADVAWPAERTSVRVDRLLDALELPEVPDDSTRITARFAALARPDEPAVDEDPWAALDIPRLGSDGPAPLPALARHRRRGAPDPAPRATDSRPLVSGPVVPDPASVPSEEQAPRAPLAVRVGLESGDQFFTGFSSDISVSGIFVETARLLPVGRAVEVFFELPGGHAVSADGRVKRVREDGKRGMGIAFRQLVREDRKRIGRYVAQRLTGKLPRV